MKTSIIVYIPHKSRKNTSDVVTDIEYQLGLRAIRKGADIPAFDDWRNCRCAPDIWELSASGLDMTAPVKRVSLGELQENETVRIPVNLLERVIRYFLEHPDESPCTSDVEADVEAEELKSFTLNKASKTANDIELDWITHTMKKL